MEDDASADAASSCMSDMDNQLSEAFDQGESSSYSVEKEQFFVGNHWKTRWQQMRLRPE